jgi:DNA-binding NarL/FixJ family response regulator
MNIQKLEKESLILLLLNDGKTQKEIANFLGCSLRKISCHAFNLIVRKRQEAEGRRRKKYAI